MKERVISALFLILVAIPIIIAGDKTFALSIGLVGIFALKEIIDLKKGHGKIPPFMMFIFIIGYLSILYLSPFDFSSSEINSRLLCVLLFLYLIPTLFYSPKKIYNTRDALYFLGVTLFLGLSCHSLILIRFKGLFEFLYVALVPILTDTFALIGGMYFGKKKLASVISPKKTWEGSIFGSLMATIIGSVFFFLFVQRINIFLIIILTLLLSVIGQLGDLFFSKMKREDKIKDFSNLIPGHGGILDRFDSMIFAALAFVIMGFYL